MAQPPVKIFTKNGLGFSTVTADRQPASGDRVLTLDGGRVTEEVFAGISKTLNAMVSNRGSIQQNSGTFNNALRMIHGRYATRQGDITDIRTLDYGGSLANNHAYSAIPAAAGISRQIEYPAGVFHDVTWAGSVVGTLNPSEFLVSDVVISSVTGLPLEIPAGDLYFELSWNPGASSVVLPAFRAASTGDAVNSGLVSQGSFVNRPLQGYVSGGVYTDNRTMFCSMGHMGTIKAPNAKSFLIAGDSIAKGVGDYGAVPRGEVGFAARSVDAGGFGLFKVTSGGGKIATHLTSVGAFTQQLKAIVAFTDFVCEFGVNDLGTNTAAQQLTACLDFASSAMGGAGLNAHQTTITPYTSSSDSWATVEGQTPSTIGARVVQLNPMIRAQAWNVLDAADYAMSSRDSGKWRIDLGAPTNSNDGLHPAYALHTAIADGIAAAQGWT